MRESYAKTYDTLFVTLTDLLGAAIGVVIAVYLRYGHILGTYRGLDHPELLYRFLIASLFIDICLDPRRDFYRRGRAVEFFETMRLTVLTVLAVVLWLYLVHSSGSLSRLVFGYYLAAGTLAVYILRLGLKSFMIHIASRSASASRLLVLVPSDRAEQALASILSSREWYRTLVGISLTDRDSAGESLSIAGRRIPIVCDREGVLDFVTHSEIDEVFVMDDINAQRQRYLPLVSALEEMGVLVDVFIDILDLGIPGKRELSNVGGLATVSFCRNIYSPREALIKRAMDIAGALVGMVVLALASIVIVPAIRLDSPGPALYKQQRVGKNGRIFTLYKFRSMYVDADERKAGLSEMNEVSGLMFKMQDDPRVTRVGRVLRRLSLDELPQFINVLKGDMSLVGTRPPTVDEYARYEAGHKARLSMRPGITGLWQISGRSNIRDFDRVVALDTSYIDNWSLREDIRIILRTIPVVLRGTGAR